MQLRKMKLMLTVLGAMGIMLTACGGEGSKSLTCSADSDCLESEMCHPDAKVCVQKCTTSADCPDSAKTCDALSSTNSQKICKCSTDVLCNKDRQAADLVCSTTSQVCVPKCTTDTDCSAGQTCDTTAGVCKPGTTTGNACSGSSQSTCSYGEFCSSSTCTAAQVAPSTCENFSQNRPDWSPSTSSGPVIYDVEGTGYQVNSAYCQSSAPDAFLVRVRAYRTDADWPSTRGELSGFFYLTTTSTPHDVVNEGLLVPNTGYNRNTSNLKDAEFNIYLCRPANSTSLQVGFVFTGGNPVCANLTH